MFSNDNLLTFRSMHKEDVNVKSTFLFEALFPLYSSNTLISLRCYCYFVYVVIVTFFDSWYFKISNINVEYCYFERYKLFTFKITLQQSIFAFSYKFVVLFDVIPPRNTRCKSKTSLAPEYWLSFWNSQNLSKLSFKFNLI